MISVCSDKFSAASQLEGAFRLLAVLVYGFSPPSSRTNEGSQRMRKETDGRKVLVHEHSGPIKGNRRLLFPEVGQGFAWKNRSISSFEAMDDSRCNVAVAVEEGEPEAAAGSVRSILVPFEVPADGKLSIASILSSTVEADVPPGSCGLVFNAVPGADGDAEEQPWTYIFALYPGYEGKAALLVQDEALEPPSPLLLAASAGRPYIDPTLPGRSIEIGRPDPLVVVAFFRSAVLFQPVRFGKAADADPQPPAEYGVAFRDRAAGRSCWEDGFAGSPARLVHD
uniref:Predicted protein n=1 Tax=Physcomitrium patens TaxID=3218 RepID=A9U6N0_PHYPA